MINSYVKSFVNKSEIKFHLYALLISLLVGAAIVRLGALRVSTIVFAAFFAFIIYLKPIYSLYAIFIYTNSIFAFDYFPQVISFGNVGLYPIDLLLIFSLIILYIKNINNQNFGGRLNLTMSRVVTVYLLIIVFTAFFSIFFLNASFHSSFNVFRFYFLYAIYFIVIYSIEYKKDLYKLINFLIIIGTFVAVMMIFQYSFGTSNKLFLGDIRVENLLGFRGITRILPPAVSLMFGLIITSFAMFLNDNNRKIRLFYIISTTLFSIGLFMSFTRAYLMPALLGMLAFIMLSKKKVRLLLILSLIFSLGIVLIKVAEFYNIQLAQAFISGYYRIMETFEGGPLETDTMIARVIENRSAMVYFSRSILFGVGFGLAFPLGLTPHNTFFRMAVDGGLLLLLPYLIISVIYIFRVLKIYIICKPEDKYLILALAITFTGFLVGSYAQPNGASTHTIPIISLIWALTELIPVLKEKTQ